MSKGQRGNKEAKKPKQVRPLVQVPAMGPALPVPPADTKPPSKK